MNIDSEELSWGRDEKRHDDRGGSDVRLYLTNEKWPLESDKDEGIVVMDIISESDPVDLFYLVNRSCGRHVFSE